MDESKKEEIKSESSSKKEVDKKAETVKQCPHCKAEIPVSAKKCSHCGSDLRSWPNQHPVGAVVLSALALFIFLGIIGGATGGSQNNMGNPPMSAPETPTTTASAKDQPQTNKANNSGDTFQTQIQQLQDQIKAEQNKQSQINSSTNNSAQKPYTTFGDGTYIVGSDILPGTYEAPGGASCYWERLSGFSGDSDIIANDLPSGTAIVTVESTDKGFEVKGCGEWQKVNSQAIQDNWHQVYSVSNNFDPNALARLGPFTLKGTQVRMTMTCTPLPPPATSGALAVSIDTSNNGLSVSPMSVHCPANNVSSSTELPPGEYYLTVIELANTYTVTVEDYY